MNRGTNEVSELSKNSGSVPKSSLIDCEKFVSLTKERLMVNLYMLKLTYV